MSIDTPHALPLSLVLVVGAVYFGLLALLAWAGETGRIKFTSRRLYGLIYGLSLAVYCTSWTFFGAVGTALVDGWDYLPIYLGPLIVFVFLFPVVRRIVEVGRGEHSTSIADFISSRFGKSRAIASLITFTAVLGLLPYIALQLKSITTSLAAITAPAGSVVTPLGPEIAFLVAIALAAFAILFGARKIDVARHSRGMVLAIAAESAVKLIALLAIAVLALTLILGRTPEDQSFTTSAVFGLGASGFSLDRFLTLTIVAGAAILCLPRQFHMAVVEAQNLSALRVARWTFSIYLVLVAAVVIPITVAGLLFGDITNLRPDLFVLTLPLERGMSGLALFAFIGGLSAATAMVIVETIALSRMISNDILLPMLMSDFVQRLPLSFDKVLLWCRRVLIIAILALAYLYYTNVVEGTMLARLGILSFSAVVQFLPALLLGLYSKRAQVPGIGFGLLAGLVGWVVFQMLPAYGDGVITAGGSSLDFDLLAAPFTWAGIGGLSALDPLTQGVLASLGLNLVFILLGSVTPRSTTASDTPDDPSPIRVGEVRALMARYIGASETRRFFDEYFAGRRKLLADSAPAPGRLLRLAQDQLSRILGAPSARVLVTSRLGGESVNPEDVDAIISEKTRQNQFSREVLAATLESMAQGVCVIDADAKIIAWNSCYQRIFDVPPDMLQVGRPFIQILNHFALTGEFGSEAPQKIVDARMSAVRARMPISLERERANGNFVLIEGAPMPGGGYVFTYTDVTKNKKIEKQLIENERTIRYYTDHAPAMIAFIDADGKFGFANKAYTDQFGRGETNLVGRPAIDYLTAAEGEVRQPHALRAFRGEAVRFDHQLVRPNGERIFVQISYVPQIEKGVFGGIYAFYQDVTARREAEEALKAANETLEERVRIRTIELEQTADALEAARRSAEDATASKTRFLAAASHDLRQPLNAARLFASALEEEVRAVSPIARDLVVNVEKSIESADHLLRALLDISRLDSGGLTPSRAHFPIQDLLSEIQREFVETAQRKGIELRVLASSAWVDSDRGLLLSILQNLVSNAVRYTEKGRILVGCRRKADLLSIEVIDTGLGIPKDKLTYIFGEFSRLERDRTREHGFGLGLAIVERTARLLGYTVSVDSEEGHGSRFAIAVPRVASRARRPERPLARANSLEGRFVLAIDNEPQILLALKELLTRWGCRVVLAESAKGALDHPDLRDERPDLMLLDFQLDDHLTGIDALHELSRAWGRRVPAILISADTSSRIETFAAQEGLPLLRKPVEVARLRALMSRLTRQAAE